MHQIQIGTIFLAIAIVLSAAGCGDTSGTPGVRGGQGVSNSDGSNFDRQIAQLRAMHAIVDIERNQAGGMIVAIDFGVVRDVTGALRIASRLPQIDRLSLENVDISSTDIELLRRMPTLRWLNLAHTTIDDEHLAFLESTPRLEFLMLWATDVSDAGLKHIAKLGRLQKLDLSATKVTGAGLSQLGGLTHLLELYVEVPSVGDSEIAQLQERLNRTLIVH